MKITQMKMKKILLSTLLLVLGFIAFAQQPIALPIDSAVRVGHLDNGLTYYIRHNEEPKQRADFHIAQAVGAILEEDNQNGLAHFLEHMAFNGTDHFPGKLIINYFESIGVNFGGNINAYTSLDRTVYRLSDVPTIREGIIDSALLVMHDWACGLTLDGKEIDDERGVIREEWRTGANAARRMWKESRKLMFPGSQYAKRDVIGDTAVINNFPYEALRAYYEKWYGPDNQAIIVVGDIDVDAIEAKIKKLWADVPARSNRGERPLYSVEDNKEPIVAVVTDKEAQQTLTVIYFKHDQIPATMKGTNISYTMDICNSLICSMLNDRFQELSMKPTCPALGFYANYGEIVKLKDAFIVINSAKEGQEGEAYKVMLTEIEKARRYGFSDDELELAKEEMLSSYEKAYNERNTRKNISLAQEYINHFEGGDAIPGIEFEYEMVKQMLPMIQVGMLNQLIATHVGEENVIIAVTGVDKEGVKIPSEAELLSGFRGMKDLAIEAPAQKTLDRTLVKKEPKAGKIKKETRNASLGTTEWLMKNGARVIFKTTDFKQDEIRLSAFSVGGKSLIATEDLPSAEIATSIVEFCGLGEFSSTDLQKVLMGKQVSVNPSIGNNVEEIEGTTTVKDFETMLQLMYLYFTAPRKDVESYETLIGLIGSKLKNRENNHKSIWRDSINLMTNNHSPRTILMNETTLKRVNMDKAFEIFSKRFSNAADFTFTFVGNIDPQDNATRALICKWIGGLPGKAKNLETVKDWGDRVPVGINKNYFSRKMQIHTASNRIQYTSYDIPYTLGNSLNMEMIGRILSTRYLESIREREGGSYGVGCAGWMNRQPVVSAVLVMQFDTDPEKQEKLINIIHEEVKTIINDGPLATDLNKEKQSMLKDFDEDIRTNEWWESTLYTYYLYGQNRLEDYKPAVEAITAETVKTTLKKLVESGNMFEVVMLPAE